MNPTIEPPENTEPPATSLGEICWGAIAKSPPSLRISWGREPADLREAFEAGARAVVAAVLPKWRPVNEPPADVREVVLVGHRGSIPVRTAFEHRSVEETHWMRMEELPEVPEAVMISRAWRQRLAAAKRKPFSGTLPEPRAAGANKTN